MRPGSSGLSAAADETGVVTHAMSVAVRLLADRTALTAQRSRAPARASFVPFRGRGQALIDVVIMLADGGEEIANIDVLHQRAASSRPGAGAGRFTPDCVAGTGRAHRDRFGSGGDGPGQGRPARGCPAAVLSRLEGRRDGPGRCRRAGLRRDAGDRAQRKGARMSDIQGRLRLPTDRGPPPAFRPDFAIVWPQDSRFVGLPIQVRPQRKRSTDACRPRSSELRPALTGSAFGVPKRRSLQGSSNSSC
jgi:hypothetical protein